MRASSDGSIEPSLAPYSQTPQMPHISVLSVARFYFPAKPAYPPRNSPASRNSITHLSVIVRDRLALQNWLYCRIQQSHHQTTRFHSRAVHAHIQSGREMKSRLVNMLTIAEELVVD